VKGKILKKNKPNYFFHKDAVERKKSAYKLVKAILNASGITPKHRKEFLALALWKVTEAEGKSKYKTRFKSKAACAAKSDLRHDHVLQRKKMVADLLAAKGNPINIDKILETAIGCTITKEEHSELDDYKKYDGWERYHKAGITVIDMETGKPLKFNSKFFK
jgi:hypothetical protein